MARLYLFAVGGTGARVLKCLCHLLAAGTPLRDEHGQAMDLVPLVIDPDKENGDTLECLGTLADYVKVKSQLIEQTGGGYPCGFFQTRVLGYRQLQAVAAAGAGAPEEGEENFRCGFIDAAKTRTFGEVIDYDFLESDLDRGEPTRLLVDALYSRTNIDTRLTGGFLGNPNVGTVVLNQVRHSRELKMLSGLFNSEDRIFLISSIFGGTGAAGFPVLLKQLRQARNEQGQEAPTLRQATVGALTVLPYFGLDDDAKSPVDANAFVPKTKAALAYYANHLGRVDALYYIGDRARKRYANTPTGITQRNLDHAIELIGATAVLHFAAQAKGGFGTPAYHECGVHVEPSKPFTLRGLGPVAHDIEEPVTQMAMMRLFLRGELSSPRSVELLFAQPWTKEGEFGRAFFTPQSPAFAPLSAYLERWWTSLANMARNDPKLQLFGDTLDVLRLDVDARRHPDAGDINKAVNALNRRLCGPPRSLQRLLTLLWKGTGDLYRKRYDHRTAVGV